LSSNGTHDASGDSKALTPTPFPACTCACTSKPENANDPAADALDTGKQAESEGNDADAASPLIAAFATVLANLSADDRQRLAAMLTDRTMGGSN
jgi:hypothetical protein